MSAVRLLLHIPITHAVRGATVFAAAFLVGALYAPLAAAEADQTAHPHGGVPAGAAESAAPAAGASVRTAAAAEPAEVPVGGGAEEKPTEMAAFEVSATRVAASEIEGPQAIEHYDSTQIDESGAFTVDEFVETLPPGADGDEQLVLIDGQPAYLDPSMLALGMIESIEVSLEGSMPEHGARANGRVINIRLKKDFSGRELAGRVREPLAGGGESQGVKFSGGFGRSRLRLMYSMEHSESEPLYASERRYSRSQDRRAEGGSDLRLPWGYPAVVQASDGVLDGLTGPMGEVAAALVPVGTTGPLTGADFLPGDPGVGSGALGQRRFDTADYRQLSAPSRQLGASLNLDYTVSPRFGIGFSGSHRDTRSNRQEAPPVSEAADGTTVPAIYSPFDEAVQVGLVHLEFGPTRRRSERARTDAGIKVNGRLGESWKWNGGVGYRRDAREEVATDLDDAAFRAALEASEPARRFNPFADARVQPVNAHLYPELTVRRSREQHTEDYRVDLAATGNALELGGGPVQLSFRSRYGERRWERVTQRSTAEESSSDAENDSSYAGSASATLPLVGARNARPGLRRLEAQVAGEYQQEGEGGWEEEVEGGVIWSPLRALLLRVRHEEEREAPSRRTDERASGLVGETLIDPRRGSSVVSDVEIRVREVADAPTEASASTNVGATLEPAIWPGFRLSVGYAERQRRNLFEDEFEAQDVLNNEAALPGRVVRAEPTDEERALGLPGRVIAVDTTGGNAGEAESRDAHFSVDYRPPEQPFGRLRITAHARHILESRYEIAPGQPFVNEAGSRFNPPDWRFRGNVSWNRRGWTVALRAEHTGAVTTEVIDDDLPSYTEFDLNLSYRWSEPFWGRFGKGVQARVTIDNLFDRDPPFADTIDGYRGGSPLGRSVSLAVSVPL